MFLYDFFLCFDPLDIFFSEINYFAACFYKMDTYENFHEGLYIGPLKVPETSPSNSFRRSFDGSFWVDSQPLRFHARKFPCTSLDL